MQSPTLPDPTTPPASPAHYTVTLPDAFAYATDRELTIPAPHTADEIATVIHAELTEYGYTDLDVTVDLAAGMARIVWQGLPLDADITGPGVGQPTKPDYWLSLADDLRQAADRVATLAGTDRQPVRVELDITVTHPGSTDLTAVDLGDRLAAAFGASTRTAALASGGRVHQVRAEIGALRVEADTYLPPERSELERLRARVAELEAQQAQAVSLAADAARFAVADDDPAGVVLDGAR